MTPDLILSGSQPADVLREYLAAEPGRTNGDAAIWLCEYFPKAADEVRHVIWNLRTSTRTFGAPDEIINAEVIRALEKAGYL